MVITGEFSGTDRNAAASFTKVISKKTKGLKLHRQDPSIKTQKFTPKHRNIPQNPEIYTKL